MSNTGRGTRQPVMYLTRVETFSACHRLHNEKLSDKENVGIFGKCNNPNGHGHNYKVEVTAKGTVDSQTGMVMNIEDLKIAIDKAVMSTLDHKNLDKDVPYFKDCVSTSENVAVFIWESLNEILPPGSLHSVKLHETDKNIVYFTGEYTN